MIFWKKKKYLFIHRCMHCIYKCIGAKHGSHIRDGHGKITILFCMCHIKHDTEITSMFNQNYFHVQSYSMDCYFRQSWVDKRLSFSGYKVTLFTFFTSFCFTFLSLFRMPLLFLLRCCERYGSQVKTQFI